MSAIAAAENDAPTLPEATGTSRPGAAASHVAAITLVVSLLALLAVVIAAMAVPALTDRTAMTVISGSMSPSLPPGHIAVYSKVDPASLVPGDVIAYEHALDLENMPITHRVIAVNPQAGLLLTQGDANAYPDPPVKHDQVIGKMDYAIPYVGILKVVNFKAGHPLLTMALGAAFSGYLAWQAAGLVRKRRAAATA